MPTKIIIEMDCPWCEGYGHVDGTTCPLCDAECVTTLEEVIKFICKELQNTVGKN